MKRIPKKVYLILGVVLIGGIVVYLDKQKVEYVAPPQTVVETQEVDMLEERIKSAQNAAQGEIQAVSQQAYDDMERKMLTEIKLQVIEEYQAELDAEATALEKEVGTY